MSSGVLQTMLTGSEAMRGSEPIRRDREKKVAWPFVWENAPPASEHLFATGFVEVPAVAASVQVLAYTVKQNYRACVRWIMMEFSGGAYNPGDMLFSVTVDKPVGSSLVQGYTVKDYSSVPFNLGSANNGPWPFMSGEESILEAKQVIRVIGTNVNLGAGSPNFFRAALIGYEWPTG